MLAHLDERLVRTGHQWACGRVRLFLNRNDPDDDEEHEDMYRRWGVGAQTFAGIGLLPVMDDAAAYGMLPDKEANELAKRAIAELKRLREPTTCELFISALAMMNDRAVTGIRLKRGLRVLTLVSRGHWLQCNFLQGNQWEAAQRLLGAPSLDGFARRA